MDKFPTELHFKSDNSKAVLVQELKSSAKIKLAEPTAEYEWCNDPGSKYNKEGLKFTITESRIKSYVEYKLLTTIWK